MRKSRYTDSQILAILKQNEEGAKVLDYRIPIRLACECFGISESGYRYTAKSSGKNALIADWLL